MIREFENAKEEAKKKQDQGDTQASKNVLYYMEQISRLQKEEVIKSLSKVLCNTEIWIPSRCC